jgi:hypothetical protein
LLRDAAQPWEAVPPTREIFEKQATMLKLLPLAMLVLSSFGMSGCHNIQPSDLTGTWLMKDSSRQALPTDLQKASPKLVVDAKGSFVASDMPGLFYAPGARAARLESGSGAWKLISSDGKQQVQLDFREIDDWNKSNLPYGTQLNVSRGWSAVSLFYFLGDADEGRRIDFERR